MKFTHSQRLLTAILLIIIKWFLRNSCENAELIQELWPLIRSITATVAFSAMILMINTLFTMVFFIFSWNFHITIAFITISLRCSHHLFTLFLPTQFIHTIISLIFAENRLNFDQRPNFEPKGSFSKWIIEPHEGLLLAMIQNIVKNNWIEASSEDILHRPRIITICGLRNNLHLIPRQ